MAGFAPHGKCTVSWQGNLLTVSYEGVFNREGAEVLGQALEAPLAERAGRPWVMLNDARLWEGGTPEAFACWASWLTRSRSAVVSLTFVSILSALVLSEFARSLSCVMVATTLVLR